jgi:hypothetical protein
MNTKTVVLLVSLGAVIAVGGKTAVVKTGHGIKAAVHHVVKPLVWTAKRVVK